jgi:hypothetical protein
MGSPSRNWPEAAWQFERCSSFYVAALQTRFGQNICDQHFKSSHLRTAHYGAATAGVNSTAFDIFCFLAGPCCPVVVLRDLRENTLLISRLTITAAFSQHQDVFDIVFDDGIGLIWFPEKR